MTTSTPITNAAVVAAGTGDVGSTFFGAGSTALTLANGMTAGLGAGALFGIESYSNPPLPITNNTGAPINPYGGDPNWPIQRIGVMRNLPGSLTNIDEVSYLYFIYNPNQIVASFQTNMGSVPPAYLYNSTSQSNVTAAQDTTGNALNTLSNSTSVPNLTNSQTVSWSLIFDRTYDMMYDQNPNENRGVLKDTAALYSLMGTFESSGAVPVSTPMQVVFGITASGQVWGFTGYISSVNITYGIFRHNMIPSRCEIDLQMVTTYVAAQAPTGAGTNNTALVTGANSTSTVNGPPPVSTSGGAGATSGFLHGN
jgi:hypothetical protein